MEDYIARPPGRVLHRARRQLALEPRAVPARRPVRGRPVHRLHAADGRRRQLVDGHARAARRLRRRAEHGQRSARPPPPERRLARHDHGPRGRPRAAGSSSCRWSRPSTRAATPTFVDDARRGRGRQDSRHAARAGHDLRRRRHPRRDRGRHRLPVQGATGLEERKAALAAVAGVRPSRAARRPGADRRAAPRGIVASPEDLGVRRTEAKRSLLAARSIDDLVAWSGGLYQPPAQVPELVNHDDPTMRPYQPVPMRHPTPMRHRPTRADELGPTAPSPR